MTYDYCPILIKLVPGKRKASVKKRIKKYLFKLYIKLRRIIMPKYLYGAHGSEWKMVDHIPQKGEDGVILRFSYNGNWYRNENGHTWMMTKRGRDTVQVTKTGRSSE